MDIIYLIQELNSKDESIAWIALILIIYKIMIACFYFILPFKIENIERKLSRIEKSIIKTEEEKEKKTYF